MLGTTDRRLVENLFFDADATAAFNEVTGCLVWSDELPDGLSPDGFATMRDLLSARGLLHRGIPIEDWQGGFSGLADTWNAAVRSRLRWTGFQRIELTQEQRALLDAYLADDSLP
jgi:hypothetical protein